VLYKYIIVIYCFAKGRNHKITIEFSAYLLFYTVTFIIIIIIIIIL